MNIVCISGRLTSDPLLKTTSNGKTFAKFTLAVRKHTSQQNSEKNADFIPCVIWGNSAELLSKTVTKGQRLMVQGAINTDEYEKDGVKHNTFSINVNSFEYVELKKEQNTPE